MGVQTQNSRPEVVQDRVSQPTHSAAATASSLPTRQKLLHAAMADNAHDAGGQAAFPTLGPDPNADPYNGEL